MYLPSDPSAKDPSDGILISMGSCNATPSDPGSAAVDDDAEVDDEDAAVAVAGATVVDAIPSSWMCRVPSAALGTDAAELHEDDGCRSMRAAAAAATAVSAVSASAEGPPGSDSKMAAAAAATLSNGEQPSTSVLIRMVVVVVVDEVGPLLELQDEVD